MKTDFEIALGALVDEYIVREKKNGTCGMSFQCLKQCVKTPPTNLKGAPRTSYGYDDVFASVINAKPSRKKFVF